jgi:hypothetical protein
MFAIAAIIVAIFPLRAIAQNAFQTQTVSDQNQITTTSDEVLTSELLSARGSIRSGGGGGGRSVSRGSGGGRSVSRGSGGGRSAGRRSSSGRSASGSSKSKGATGGGTGKSATGGGTGKSATGGGTGKSATGGGTGKSATGGGTGKSATGGGTGKSATGGGTGKSATGGGTGKLGVGPGKSATGGGTGKSATGGGTGKLGAGPGKSATGGGTGKSATGGGTGKSATGGGTGKSATGGGTGKLGGGIGGGALAGGGLGGRGIGVRQGPYRLWFGGRWVTFVGVGTLAAILVGTDYYYPYGYVSIAQPWCSGVTDDGCRLHWQTVALQEGGEQVQCVQYCPRRVSQSVAPAVTGSTDVAPAAAVSLAEVPPEPRGKCEVVIYADSSLKGLSAPTSDDQASLMEAGWKNEIASIEVKQGTWDFFTDDNYAGATMRLAPGSYGELGADWAKKIGSFSCTSPAS